jgi:alpha-mannosidase
LRFQILDAVPQEFWQHHFVRVLTEIFLPACGWATCVLGQDKDMIPDAKKESFPRVEKPYVYALENEYLRAEFCPRTGELTSLLDKASDTELLNAPSAFFRMIEEQIAENTAGTAWTVGRYRRVTEMTSDVEIRNTLTGPLKNAVTVTTRCGASTVAYTVSLAVGSHWLDIDCDVDWREAGIPGQNTPQLNFTLPLAGVQKDFIHDVPGGLLRRAPVAQDMPCQSFAAAQSTEGRAIMLISDSKYGFRCENAAGGSSISLNCLRSSTDPDPTPEFGRHRFRVGIGVSENTGIQLLNTAYAFCHPPIAINDRPREGSLPMRQQLIHVEGAFLQAVKMSEDGNRLIIRLTEVGGQGGEAAVSFWADIKAAEETDVHERALPENRRLSVEGNALLCSLTAYSTTHFRITL